MAISVKGEIGRLGPCGAVDSRNVPENVELLSIPESKTTLADSGWNSDGGLDKEDGLGETAESEPRAAQCRGGLNPPDCRVLRDPR